MAQIGLNISISGLTGKLIIRWVMASSPLVEVGRSSAFDFPFDDVYLINDIAPVVYIVQLWRSNDGTALDQLIKDWAIDASKEATINIKTYQYKVGRGNSGSNPNWADPSNADSYLVDQRLDGFTKDQLIVHEAGYGDHLDEEYNLFPGGGIQLLNDKTFDQDVAWFITTISAGTTTIASNIGNGQLFGAIITISADRDVYISDSDNLYNKLCLAAFTGSVGTINFPALSLIPDNVHITFQTHGGAQNYLVLQLNPGDTIKFFNADVNTIYLAKNEKIDMYFKSGIGYIIAYDGNADKRGRILYSYYNEAEKGNYILADQSIGELNKSDYPGLYDFINTLSGTAVCSLGTGVGQWSYSNAGVYENKQKYGIDTVGLKIRVPHLSGLIAKANSNPGVYEGDAVGHFSGDVHFPTVSHGSSSSPQDGQRVKMLVNLDGVTPAGNAFAAMEFNSGVENLVKSYSQKPYVIL